ncbi:MAG: UDP-glucose/GDP-mannose dehydrogenase family protein [Chloroflexota bacterium]
MQLAIVGAGYVGLVTAACLVHLGHDITCLDIDAARVERLSRGELPVHEPDLDDLVAEGLAEGRLRFRAEYSAIEGHELVIVCVGTLDAREEWSGHIVRAAVSDIASDARLPRMIVIRSTLLPGTAVAIADEVRDVDSSVRLAHNPEFTREAVAVSDFLAPDRVVIGVDGHDDGAAGTALADALRRVYAPLDAPTVVTDLTSAETIKLASNVFLAAKITFANEMARLAAATGADAAAVVDGMGLDKRIGRSFLSPGPGFGGSCFPSQSRALPELAHRFGVQTPLMDAVWPSNLAQADWLLDGLERAAGQPLAGMRVALLGLTFKAGTDDLRESPALRLGELMLARGADVVAFDPVALESGSARLRDFASATDGAATVVAAESAADACAAADAVVLATEWPQFKQLDWAAIAATMKGRLIVDGRHVVDGDAATAAGLRVISLGVEPKEAALLPAG